MTLEQALEKAAVLDGEFVTSLDEGFFEVGGIDFGIAKSGKPVEIIHRGIKDSSWQLCGAVCARCEEKEWYLFRHKGLVGIRDLRLSHDSIAMSVVEEAECESLAHAAVLAYVEALEARQKECPECGGKGWVPDYSNTYGRLPEHPEEISCPSCTGKPQQATP